jgi:hypothetical protein
MNSAEAHERLLVNDEFWRMFLPLFHDEAMVREFSQITQIPEVRIRAAREKFRTSAAATAL